MLGISKNHGDGPAPHTARAVETHIPGQKYPTPLGEDGSVRLSRGGVDPNGRLRHENCDDDCVSLISIRSASAEDLVALQDVYRRSSLSNEGDRSLLNRHPELLDWEDSAVREGRTRIALIDDRVVGFATAAFKGATAEVEDLFVDPGWMRHGVGRALIEDLAVTARSNGLSHLEVDANPHAVAFYRQVGFIDLGEVPVEYGSGMRMRRTATR